MNKKIVKICIFDKHSTPSQVLGGNGDYILDNICIEAKTEEGLDGNYVLDATFIIDNEGLYNQISEEAILKVRLDYGDEIFVISKINKGTRYIDVFARQITIDETLNMWIEDIRPTNTSGLSALNTLKNNSIGKKDIIIHSDISNVATAYYMDMNMYKALHDCEQSFINRWGGEIQRRGYNLTINKRIGADRGVQIRSRKNLSGFELQTDMDKLVTRLYPKTRVEIDNKYKSANYGDSIYLESSKEGVAILSSLQGRTERIGGNFVSVLEDSKTSDNKHKLSMVCEDLDSNDRTIQELLLDEPLRGIDNVYCDSIYEDDSKEIKIKRKLGQKKISSSSMKIVENLGCKGVIIPRPSDARQDINCVCIHDKFAYSPDYGIMPSNIGKFFNLDDRWVFVFSGSLSNDNIKNQVIGTNIIYELSDSKVYDKAISIRCKSNTNISIDAGNIVSSSWEIRYPVEVDVIPNQKYVDSPLINSYSHIRSRKISFDDIKLKTESNPNEGFESIEDIKNELIRRCMIEFNENNIDKPKSEYRIDFVSLEQTEEYKNYAQAERVYIGDTVNVYEEKHDINISVRAISRKYDVLRQRVIEIELSNYDIKQKSITTSDILAELGSVIEQTKNNNVQEIIQSMINAGIKDSYVIPRQNEVIVADNKDIDKAMNVIRLNKNGLAFSQTGYHGTYEYGFTIDGIINASLIRSGILSGIIVESRGEGSERVVMTQKGLDFYSDTNVAGNIFYDSNGEGTVESAKDRFLIESLNGYVLKLKSSGDVSIEAGEGKKIFLTSDTKVGGSLSCDSISTLYSTCYGDFHVAPNMFGGESAFKVNSVTGDASVAGNMWATEFRQLTTSVNLPFMFNISSKPNCFDILNSFETKVINNNLVLDATYEDEVEEYLNPCLNKDENGNVSIGINSVIANLTDCIKELKKEIDTLKNSSI